MCTYIITKLFYTILTHFTSTFYCSSDENRAGFDFIHQEFNDVNNSKHLLKMLVAVEEQQVIAFNKNEDRVFFYIGTTSIAQ